MRARHRLGPCQKIFELLASVLKTLALKAGFLRAAAEANRQSPGRSSSGELFVTGIAATRARAASKAAAAPGQIDPATSAFKRAAARKTR